MSTTDLKSIRDLLKDRETNPAKTYTATVDICLDLEAAQAVADAANTLADLRIERDTLITSAAKDTRMAAGADPTTIDTQISDAEHVLEAAQKAAFDVTAYVTLRAIPARAYQRTLNAYPDRDKDPEQLEQFYDELIDACLVTVKLGDLVQDITWSDFAEDLTDGEKEPVQTAAAALNRRKIDLPKSFGGSGTTR